MALFYKSLFLVGGLLTAGAARAQAPYLQNRLPQANAVAAPRTAPLQLTFSEPMSAQTASPDAVRVVSAWRGRLAGTFQGAGTNTISFTPAQPLLVGEPVQVGVGTQATSQAGTALAAASLFQFTAATAPSTGRFLDEEVTLDLGPRCMAVGDINNDGNPDFVAGGSDNMLAVRLGDGQGGFAPPPAPIPASSTGGGSAPSNVELADVNKDGFLDMLVADGSSRTMAISLGDGTGRFTIPAAGGRIYPPGESLRGLVVADFNADGNLDFAVGLSRSSQVAVYYGNGKAGFTAQPLVAIDSLPLWLAVGDVNADGRPDLLSLNTTSAGSSVSVRLNDGAGGFTARPLVAVAPDGYTLVLGDIDNNGTPDILTTSSSTNSVSVRLGDGSGGFTAPATPEVKVGPTPRNIALADLNRDGRLDFVTANNQQNTTTVSVRLGNGAGGFSPAAVPEVTVGLQPYALALQDINKDGQPDLLAGNMGIYYSSTVISSYSLTVRLGNGAGGFVMPAGEPVALADAAIKTAVGDLNNDGRLDILSINSRGVASVRLGDGKGRFAPPPAPTPADISSIGTYPGCLALGDLNNDGNLDFVTNITVQFSPRLAIYLGDGRGGFSPLPASVPPVPIRFDQVDMVLTDLTGDGNLDLLGCSRDQGVVSVRLGTGTGTFTTPAVPEVSVGNAPLAVAAGDFNNDGRMDFATANYVQRLEGSVSIRLGDGTGRFAPPAAPAPAEVQLGEDQPNDIALGDLNNDGNLDFVICSVEGLNGAGNNVCVRLGTGTGAFTTPAVARLRVSLDPTGVALGDVNGDGNLDVVSSAKYRNRMAVRFGDGKGGLTVPATGGQVGVGPSPSDILLADVDNDGDLDALLPHGAARSLSVRLNGIFTGTVLPVRQPTALASAPRLVVYPNPARQVVRLEHATPHAPLVLFDLLGREQRRQPAGPSFDLSGLTPGLYILRSGTQSAHLVVE
ncbi:FG-GAP-like repeat-containing protein [Hymenobacter sp. DG01]|uniref:FG-GAP-like repeat-containing protein n=1 Tax=Hymenobacter sp. DG01 TaxID=2584940 RepID=UPI00111CC82C|nr:FG-GAP-like repeat-containing protein [Hymenobacter sp. DG01]